MSEFALSSPPEENPINKKIGFSTLLLSDFHLFVSFILSHPFYFSYILFFSPYIFKILSFLSPLFVTTTLVLLALLSTLHFSESESPETQPSFLFSFCSKLVSVLEETKFDEDVKSLEELEAYKMVVEACSIMCASENESVEITFVDKFCNHESTISEASTDETHEEAIEIQPLKFVDPMETEKCEKEEEEEEEEEEKVKPKSDVVLDSGEGQCWKKPTKQESKAQKVGLVGDGNDESYDDLPKLSDFLGQVKKYEATGHKEEDGDVSLRSFGSMRKEKEWRRTLACKLFEERHNADVGQGMDHLWETYETETEKKQNEEEKKKKEKKTKKSMMMMKTKSIEKKEVVVEEEEEDEDGIDQQQLCCLQALKFSTGKMHMGIARPNLMKLSKAFKGIGRFYNNATKHSKKA